MQTFYLKGRMRIPSEDNLMKHRKRRILPKLTEVDSGRNGEIQFQQGQILNNVA